MIDRRQSVSWTIALAGCALLAGCGQLGSGGSGGGGTSAPSASSAPVAQPVAATSAGATRTVKSRDGSFDGKITGTPAARSKFAKVQIGMRQREVEDLIGAPNDTDSHITGKAFIPFFFGGDTHRQEAFYKNEGYLTYSPQHYAGEPNTLIAITVNPDETGYAR